MIRHFLATLFLTALLVLPSTAQNKLQSAIFAGGCFWCVESDFDHLNGVVETVSGYSGGDLKNPTYQNHEGHREVVKITYDPAKVSYEQLLEVFWHSVDPTDNGGQFCDRGFAYTTAVYAQDNEQLQAARASKEALKSAGKKIVTPVEPAKKFWEAEGYHQDYYKKNPARYNYYRFACRRDATVKKVWGEDAYAGLDKSS